jgi:hypothetical protein
MNSTISYMPNGDTDRVAWLHNFSTKLPLYASLFNISQQELEEVQKGAVMFRYIINMLEACRQSVINLTGYKNLMKHAAAQQAPGPVPVMPVLPAPGAIPQGLFDRISRLVKRIKAHVNYNEAPGKDLGIIATPRRADHSSMQPVLKLVLHAGRPVISCKKGAADGMDLYVDRNDGAGFILLAQLMLLKYTDKALLPEQTPVAEWSYKAMYRKGDKNIGEISKVVSVVVKRK